MVHVKKQLEHLIQKVVSGFPDEQDLKGFAGISKSAILSLLQESVTYAELLIPYDNEVETIFLKRELADLFEKTEKEMGDKFDRIKHSVFNSILRNMTKMKALIRQTYSSLVQAPVFRTEAQVAAATQELLQLTEIVKRIKDTDTVVKSESDKALTSITTKVKEVNQSGDTAILAIPKLQQEIAALKETASKQATAYTEELTAIKKKVTAVSTDMEIKQKKAGESEQKMDAFLVKIDTSNTKIETINQQTTLWKQQIEDAKTGLQKNAKEFESFTQKTNLTQKELEEVHEKILGKRLPDGAVTTGHLQEIEELKNRVTLLLAEQLEKYNAQFGQIESLLPGATTAGLTEAFEKQKRSYDRPIRLWSWVFIAITSLMTLSSMYLFYVQFIRNDFATETLSHGLLSLLRDLPFFIPTIWLAVFASKQQSQYKRLQQEYAFKEINAKSFYGHKKQIEELNKGGSANPDLMAQMVQLLVYITAENPSATLDSKSHNDAPPLFALLKELNPLGKKNQDNEKAKKEEN